MLGSSQALRPRCSGCTRRRAQIPTRVELILLLPHRTLFIPQHLCIHKPDTSPSLPFLRILTPQTRLRGFRLVSCTGPHYIIFIFLVLGHRLPPFTCLRGLLDSLPLLLFTRRPYSLLYVVHHCCPCSVMAFHFRHVLQVSRRRSEGSGKNFTPRVSPSPATEVFALACQRWQERGRGGG